MIELKFAEYIKQILVSNRRDINMKYYEVPVSQAMKICKRNATVLVAEDDLENGYNTDVIFSIKKQSEYETIFNDVKTVASYMDEFVKQLRCYTVKQDIHNIKPKGKQRIILLNK